MADKIIPPRIQRNLLRIRKNLTSVEDEYYQVASLYILYLEGIEYPTEEQVLRTKNYLLSVYVGFSHILGKELTEREIEILYKTTEGNSFASIASDLNISKTRAMTLRLSILRKLQAENLPQAIYIATRLCQLPPKEPNFLNYKEKEEEKTGEIENK